jgi:hypothetical protein
VKEAKTLFRYRTRAANFKENFRNSYARSYEDYSDIFAADFPQDISKTLIEIYDIRESLL